MEAASNHYFINNIGQNLIKSGPGILRKITICTGGGVAGSLWTIYDNTTASGTIIGIFTGAATNITLHFNTWFSTGLYINQTGPSPTTAPYITVIYD